jgi:hypothetical protein
MLTEPPTEHAPPRESKQQLALQEDFPVTRRDHPDSLLARDAALDVAAAEIGGLCAKFAALAFPGFDRGYLGGWTRTDRIGGWE